MQKDNCVDREGKTHFGEFGFYDGYIGSCGNCRVSLKARSGACQDADSCAEKLQESIKNKSNIVSSTINNMNNGVAQRKKEDGEDKAIATAKREEEKLKLEEAKKKAEEPKIENDIKEIKDTKVVEEKTAGTDNTQSKEEPKQ